MGNCLNKAAKQQQRAMPEEEEGLELRRSIGQVLQEEEEEEEVCETAAAGLKVKVVLTRAELEWLMAQLKTGERRLEDVLHQMGSARADKHQQPPPRDGWRPRLESILECHEGFADGGSLATT